MSPEQARGQPIDGRTDLFSLGGGWYGMATGEVPFDGETTAVVFDAILNRPPIAPSERQGVSSELERIILRLLEKDPAMRYQTASDLRADLKRLRRDSLTGLS